MRKDFLDVCHEKFSYILKAIVPADNYSYEKRSFEHPTRRQIFADTLWDAYVNSISHCDIYYGGAENACQSIRLQVP